MKRIDENHSFNIHIANAVGIEKAILLKELKYWCEQNQLNGKHIHTGRAWTYNTAKAFAGRFTYMNPKSIARWLDEMERDGWIESSNLNATTFDRTKWYSVDFEKYDTCISHGAESISQNEKWICHFEKSISQNEKWICHFEKSISQNGEPYHTNNPSNNPSNPTTTREHSDFFKLKDSEISFSDPDAGIKCAQSMAQYFKAEGKAQWLAMDGPDDDAAIECVTWDWANSEKNMSLVPFWRRHVGKLKTWISSYKSKKHGNESQASRNGRVQQRTTDALALSFDEFQQRFGHLQSQGSPKS